MNSIEQKLRSDAKKFKQDPSQTVLENIFQNMDEKPMQPLKSQPKILKWVFPLGLTVALLVIMVSISMIFNTGIPIDDGQLANQVQPLTIQNIDSFVMDLEDKIADNIVKERGAILADIENFKSLLFL